MQVGGRIDGLEDLAYQHEVQVFDDDVYARLITCHFADVAEP